MVHRIKSTILLILTFHFLYLSLPHIPLLTYHTAPHFRHLVLASLKKQQRSRPRSSYTMQIKALAGISAVVALSGLSLLGRSYIAKTPSEANPSPSLEVLVNLNHPRSLRLRQEGEKLLEWRSEADASGRRLTDYKTVSFKPQYKGQMPDYVPRRSATTAKKCENPITSIPRGYFKSQSQEDEKLLGWFQNFCGGTYLELGGLDGVKYSNSYVFNKGESPNARKIRRWRRQQLTRRINLWPNPNSLNLSDWNSLNTI